MKLLLLLRGLPGSGKTTLAEYLTSGWKYPLKSDFANSKMVAADDYEGLYQNIPGCAICTDDTDIEHSNCIGPEPTVRFNGELIPSAHQWCQKEVDRAMFDTTSLIVVHNTFTENWQLDPYYAMAKEYGYDVHSVIVENRHHGVSTHNVPAEKMIDYRTQLFDSIDLG